AGVRGDAGPGAVVGRSGDGTAGQRGRSRHGLLRSEWPKSPQALTLGLLFLQQCDERVAVSWCAATAIIPVTNTTKPATASVSCSRTGAATARTPSRLSEDRSA